MARRDIFIVEAFRQQVFLALLLDGVGVTTTCGRRGGRRRSGRQRGSRRRGLAGLIFVLSILFVRWYCAFAEEATC